MDTDYIKSRGREELASDFVHKVWNRQTRELSYNQEKLEAQSWDKPHKQENLGMDEAHISWISQALSVPHFLCLGGVLSEPDKQPSGDTSEPSLDGTFRTSGEYLYCTTWVIQASLTCCTWVKPRQRYHRVWSRFTSQATQNWITDPQTDHHLQKGHFLSSACIDTSIFEFFSLYFLHLSCPSQFFVIVLLH